MPCLKAADVIGTYITLGIDELRFITELLCINARPPSGGRDWTLASFDLSQISMLLAVLRGLLLWNWTLASSLSGLQCARSRGVLGAM